MAQNALDYDCSWDKSLDEYNKVYTQLDKQEKPGAKKLQAFA